jgi:hypothetical protein
MMTVADSSLSSKQGPGPSYDNIILLSLGGKVNFDPCSNFLLCHREAMDGRPQIS